MLFNIQHFRQKARGEAGDAAPRPATSVSELRARRRLPPRELVPIGTASREDW